MSRSRVEWRFGVDSCVRALLDAWRRGSGMGGAAVVLAIASIILTASATGEARAQEAASEAVIKIDTFGVGGMVRAGSYAAVRVGIAYSGPEPVNAIVAIERPDADGDLREDARRVTLNPGNANHVWLYPPLLADVDNTSTWTVTIHERDDQDRAGRQIAAQVVRGNRWADPEQGMIGVVGNRDGNLNVSYGPRSPMTAQVRTAHEETQVISGLQPGDLPDRWMGLEAFEALVWTDGDPRTLAIETTAAISEWVRRGGHLVIVLPQVGMPWVGTGLDGLLPEVRVTKWEGQEIRDLTSAGGVLRHLSRDATVPPDRREPRYPVLTLNLFEPVGGSWTSVETVPLMEVTAPGGGGARNEGAGAARRYGIVVQRAAGFGRVTMIGVDVTDPRLNRAGVELPHGEVFWNVVLGRRQDTPGPAEIDELTRDPKGPLARSVAIPHPLGTALGSMIELSAEASSGVVVALVLFIVYWLVSGPAAFSYLRHRGWSKHNWTAFVAISAVFTAISWLGARALRSNEILPRHLTILDHIADGPTHRATTYLTAALDGYGRQTVEVDGTATFGGDESGGGEARPTAGGTADVVESFVSPGERSSTFPDPRMYRVMTDRPNRMEAPARSTAKQVVCRSMVAPQAKWGMPNYESEADRPRVVDGQLSGVLTHHLPGALTGVTIILVTSEAWSRTEGPRRYGTQSGRPRLRAYAWTRSSWLPGTPLDLGDPTFKDRSKAQLTMEFQAKAKALAQAGGMFYSGGAIQLSPAQEDAMLLVLSFYQQIDPPRWIGRGDSDQETRFTRHIGREWDLSGWLNRPCLIIMGHLRGSAMVTPVSVSGQRLEDSNEGSQTFVRWIYPLPVESEPGETGSEFPGDEGLPPIGAVDDGAMPVGADRALMEAESGSGNGGNRVER